MNNDYYIFRYTKEELERKFSKNILNKFLQELAFLYQNGYELNCKEEEIDEQLSLFNYFQTSSDFEELASINSANHSSNKRIVAEELFDILKKSVFVNKDQRSPNTIKECITENWDNVVDAVSKIEYILVCQDLDIKTPVHELTNFTALNNCIEKVKDSIDRNLKVLTWIKFGELVKITLSLHSESLKKPPK